MDRFSARITAWWKLASALFALLLLGVFVVGPAQEYLRGVRDALRKNRRADASLSKPPSAGVAEVPDVASQGTFIPANKNVARAEISSRDVKVIRHIPRTASELESAHDRHRADACEAIAPDEPFEITTFTPYLTKRDSRPGRRDLPMPSARRHIFSVGLDMWRQDQAALPLVSRGAILKYIQDHYISIQARIQRDPLDGAEFLHHRPLAATMTFRKSGTTQPFTDAVTISVRDMRSLGMFVPVDALRTPENLRTMVLMHKNHLASTESDILRSKPDYEYIFIRARNDEKDDSAPLVLHAFATTERRKLLHFVNSTGKPRRAGDCGAKGTVVFTKYSHGNIYPTAAVIRQTTVRSKSSFGFAELDEYVRSQDLTGDALDHLTFVLDAIIDRKLSPSDRALR